MRALFVISIVSLSLCAYPQKPSDWRKSSLTPLQFAGKVDKGLYNLKGALGQATFRAKFFDGGSGNGRLTNRIRDRRNFRVEFVRIDPKARDPFVGQIMVGTNGNLNLVTATVGIRPLVPGKNPGFVPASASPVQMFPEHFTQLMFEHYATGAACFSPLVKALLKGDGGFTVKMETRTMQGNGRSIPQVRLFASRTPAAAKRLGTANIEIVTDTNMWLPLQIRVNMTNLKKQNALFDWQSMWSGPFRFEDKWFKKPTK